MVVPPEVHTLAERLTENGISTAAFVSAAVLHPRLGLDQGFDVYDHPTGSERRGEETRARASAWLRQIGDHRFFCFVHLYDPHTWYTPPEPYREMYGVPPGQHPPDRTFVRDPSLLTPSAIRNAIDAYDAEIQYADAQLGALLQTLDELDLRKNTVVVVLSDHGESLDELLEEFGYAFDHGEFLYRSELRIPLVLWTPRSMGLPAGTIQDAIVTTLDLMPTLLELLGIPGHGGARGRSLIPLLSGSLLPPRPAFADRRLLTRAEVMQPPSRFLQGEEISVTTRKWHFLRCEGRPDELFDLASDPLETLNVVDTEPKVAERMRRLIDLRRPFDQTDRVPSSTVDPELAEKLRSLGYVVDSPNS
jgi:arylsulfatase A-like enzyme